MAANARLADRGCDCVVECEVPRRLVGFERVGHAHALAMYRKILVALENSHADETLLPHVAGLAKLHGSGLLLVHVADGFVARNYEQLGLAESREMKEDRVYL